VTRCTLPPMVHAEPVRVTVQWCEPDGTHGTFEDAITFLGYRWRDVRCQGLPTNPHPPGHGPSSKCPRLNFWAPLGTAKVDRRGKGGSKQPCRP